MAGCKYETPTKEDVIRDIKFAFRTLDNYLDLNPSEPIPSIYYELIDFINKESSLA